MRHDFKPWPLNDIYHVQEALQAYDKDLYLLYNAKTNEHLIMDGVVNMAVMKIPQPGFPELTSKVVDHIRKIHILNGFNAAEEIRKNEEEIERRQAREAKNLAEDLAKETYKATMEEQDFGRRLSTFKGVSV